MSELGQAYKTILNRFDLVFGIKADDGTIATSVLDWMDFSIQYDKDENCYDLTVESLLWFETKNDAVRYYTNMAIKLEKFIIENYPEFKFDFETIQETDITEMNTLVYKEFITKTISSDNLFEVFREFLRKFALIYNKNK